MRPALEVADIFRRHGDAFRAAQGGRLLPNQRSVMAAIERAGLQRSAAMSSSAMTAAWCASLTTVAVTGTVRSAKAWRAPSGLPIAKPDLLPVPYFHVVFTVPAPIAAIALQNKAVVYDILRRSA
jgi:hypothetical protein